MGGFDPVAYVLAKKAYARALTAITSPLTFDLDFGGYKGINIGAPTQDTHVPRARASDILSGVFDVARIPNLDASKITSGRFPMARMPTAASGVLKAKGLDVDPAFELIVDGDVQNVDASKITSGVLSLERIPSPLTGKELDRNEVLKAVQNFKGLFWFNINWLPAGMLRVATTGSGTIEWYSDSVRVNTGTTSGSYAYILKYVGGGVYSWDKMRYFGVRVDLDTYSAQYVHIVSGVSSVNAAENASQHIGFKLINANLYGTVGNGATEQTLLLETLTSWVRRRLECVLIPGVECRFYVDGVDKGAITSSLPSYVTNAHYLFWASAYNTEAANKYFDVFEAKILQVE
jgi:hypothetical protein